MKKNLLFLFMFIGWLNQSNAQYYRNSFLCLDCYTNIEIGANLPMISGLENSKSKVGFNVSLHNYKEINERIYLKFGPTFSQFRVGFDDAQKEDLVINSAIANLGVHYLKQRDYQFFGGVNAEVNVPKGWFKNIRPEHEINSLTFSLYAGGGLIFAERLELSARYNLGLNNLSDDPNLTWKRNYITLSLGYTFL